MDAMLVVTLISVALSATMAVVAWKVVRDDHRRSDARVAALAADFHDVNAGSADDRQPGGAPIDNLFASAEAPRERRTLMAVLGAGALVVGGVATLLVLLTGGADTPALVDQERLPAAAQPAAPPAALELTALSHEREGDHLTVRGVVRNPPTGATVNHLTAVVLLFGAQGGFLTSGRAEVDTPAVTPGTEARFAITIPGAADVGRYRVSFRTADRVLPHVDGRKSTGEGK